MLFQLKLKWIIFSLYQEWINKAFSHRDVQVTLALLCSLKKMRDTYYDQEIGMRTGEDRYVHRHSDTVRFVQTNSKIPLSAQQQKDENTNVH